MWWFCKYAACRYITFVSLLSVEACACVYVVFYQPWCTHFMFYCYQDIWIEIPISVMYFIPSGIYIVLTPLWMWRCRGSTSPCVVIQCLLHGCMLQHVSPYCNNGCTPFVHKHIDIYIHVHVHVECLCMWRTIVPSHTLIWAQHNLCHWLSQFKTHPSHALPLITELSPTIPSHDPHCMLQGPDDRGWLYWHQLYQHVQNICTGR